MEDLVESYIIKAGYEKNVDYFKEMYLSDIEKRWGLDLSEMSGDNTSTKRFDFVIKTPPASFLLKKYAKINKGSVKGSKEVVGTITEAQLREIAEIKLPDLNAYSVEEAMKIVAGTAKNMGIAVEGQE